MGIGESRVQSAGAEDDVLCTGAGGVAQVLKATGTGTGEHQVGKGFMANVGSSAVLAFGCTKARKASRLRGGAQDSSI